MLSIMPVVYENKQTQIESIVNSQLWMYSMSSLRPIEYMMETLLSLVCQQPFCWAYFPPLLHQGAMISKKSRLIFFWHLLEVANVMFYSGVVCKNQLSKIIPEFDLVSTKFAFIAKSRHFCFPDYSPRLLAGVWNKAKWLNWNFYSPNLYWN